MLRTVGPEQAELVASWATSEQEARWWAGAPYPVPPSLVSSWADDPDAHGFVLYHGTEPIAYGEIWDDADEGESELAHLIVAPDCRGQGFGRRLVRSLVPRAGFGALVMRVHPDNSAAQAVTSAPVSAGWTRPAKRSGTRLSRCATSGWSTPPSEWCGLRHRVVGDTGDRSFVLSGGSR